MYIVEDAEGKGWWTECFKMITKFSNVIVAIQIPNRSKMLSLVIKTRRVQPLLPKN